MIDGTTHNKEWISVCRDCGVTFSYSEGSYQQLQALGEPRPQRCPPCQESFRRYSQHIGMSTFPLTPLRLTDTLDIQPGELGTLSLYPAKHFAAPPVPRGTTAYPLTDDDVRRICTWLRDPAHQVAIVQGPTGYGKSRVLPYRLIVPPEGIPADLFTRHGPIAVTEPRIIATSGAASYVAQNLYGTTRYGAGYDIGYRHMWSPSSDWRNKLIYMTDGTLIKWIIRGYLERLSIVMIDEAHERNKNIDLCLSLLKHYLPRYPHLKLIISSATLNVPTFQRYFELPEGAFIRLSEERIHTLQTSFRSEESTEETLPYHNLPQLEIRVVEEASKKVIWLLNQMAIGKLMPGGILVFLHGEGPIHTLVQNLSEKLEDIKRYEKLNNKQKVSKVLKALAERVEVYPLYRNMPEEQQTLAVEGPPTTADEASEEEQQGIPRSIRIVVATNIAQVSVTVKGVLYEVDSGLIKEDRWNPETGKRELVTVLNSRMGSEQRWGRVGREKEGIAYCLYTREQYEKLMPAEPTSEFERSPLDQFVLHAKAAGIDNLEHFDWIEKSIPPKELIRAQQAMQQLGAIDEQGNLTEYGLELEGFAYEPIYAHLMSVADRCACAVEMATLIPMIKRWGYRQFLRWERKWDAATQHRVSNLHNALKNGCRDDIEFCLKLYSLWKDEAERWAHAHFVDVSIFKNVIEPEREQLLSTHSSYSKQDGQRPIDFDLLDRVRLIFAYCLRDRIYTWQSGHFYQRLPAQQEQALPAEILELDGISLCSGQQDVQALVGVAVKPQKDSPDASPHYRLSFTARIEPEWLDWLSQPGHTLAALEHYIHLQTREPDGTFPKRFVADRLFLTNRIPLGSRYYCMVTDVFADRSDGIRVVLSLTRAAQPPSIHEVFRTPGTPMMDSEDEGGGTEDEDEEEEEEQEMIDSIDSLQAFHPGVPNPEETLSFSPSLLLEDSREPATTLIHLPSEKEKHMWPTMVFGYLDRTNTEYRRLDKLLAEVVGYDFSDDRKPQVIMRPTPCPDSFMRFTELYHVGDTVTVEIVGHVYNKYQHGRRYKKKTLLVALVVREPQSGYETILNLQQFSFTPDWVTKNDVPLHAWIGVRVEAIDSKHRSSSLSCLPLLDKMLAECLMSSSSQEEDTYIVDAVVHKRKDEELSGRALQSLAFLRLACSDVQHSLFIFAAVPRTSLDHLQAGADCRVRLSFKALMSDLEELPPEIVPLPGGEGAFSRLQWRKQKQKRRLYFKGYMSYQEYAVLRAASQDENYRRVIDSLYAQAHRFQLLAPEVPTPSPDMEKASAPAPRPRTQYEPGMRVLHARVHRVGTTGAIVTLPQQEPAWLDKAEMTWSGNEAPEEVVDEDQLLEVRILHIEERILSGHEPLPVIHLTLLKPEEAPQWQPNYQVGSHVTGKVWEVQPAGILIELGFGILGWLPGSQAYNPLRNRGRVFHHEDAVEVIIKGWDESNRRFDLDLHSHADPQETYAVGKEFYGKVTYVQQHRIFVELEPDVKGVVQTSQMWGHVPDATRVYNIHQRVHVRSLGWNKLNNMFDLSMKTKENDPFYQYEPGDYAQGYVTRVEKSRVFIELEPGIFGMLPTSEMWGEIKDAHGVFAANDEVQVYILDCNEEHRNFLFSTREIPENDPFIMCRSGQSFTGTITGTLKFGVFVRLLPGVCGLLHRNNIRGRLSDARYAAGNSIRVRIIRHNSNEAARNFELMEEE